MKKIILLLLLVASSLITKAQYYVSIMPSTYTNAGGYRERLTADIEFGYEWKDDFSMGIEFGKTNFTKKEGRDTCNYMEWRPNLNVFHQGHFTNTLTIGFGYIFNAKQNFLTECSTGIEYSINKHYHYNLYFGTYYFTGETYSSNQNFLGMSIIYYFVK